MRKVVIGTVLATALVAAQPALAQRCEHSRDIDLTVDAATAGVAAIHAGAGSLVVEGRDGDQIVVTGRACASDADRLEDMDVVVHSGEDRVEISTEIPEHSGWSWLGGRYAYIDLQVAVPERMLAEILDGSGSLTVHDVAGVELTDGSGDITVRAIDGDVSIADGSGSIELDGIGGEIRVQDGSGGLRVVDAGSVVVEADGSGGIEVEHVRGSVRVIADGSGSIAVADIGGDFTVEQDGSGGIRHRDVAGTVKIPKRR